MKAWTKVAVEEGEREREIPADGASGRPRSKSESAQQRIAPGQG